MESWTKKKLKEIYDISDVLYKEGHSSAECRYIEVVATILLFIESHLSVLRTLSFFFLGAFVAHLLF